MLDQNDIRLIASALLFNEKGYVTEEDLNQEHLNWINLLDEVSESLLKLGMTIKSFLYRGMKCYAAIGIPSNYDSYLTEKESFLLLDFMIRIELFSAEEGLDRRKWRELLDSKGLGKSRLNFAHTLTMLKKKGLLEEKNSIVKGGWRYFACLDVKNLLQEIKTEAKLNMLIGEYKQESGLID